MVTCELNDNLVFGWRLFFFFWGWALSDLFSSGCLLLSLLFYSILKLLLLFWLPLFGESNDLDDESLLWFF